MSDFTKEELEDILQWGVDRLLDNPQDTKTRNICYKFKSMIDNYCEHEYKKTLDKSGMFYINMCHKCRDSNPWSILDDNQ